jgi:DnaJ-class molecular chaperone
MKHEVINKTKKIKCYICNGTGKESNKKCRNCKGTGVYKATNYFIVVDGNAFQMDTVK